MVPKMVLEQKMENIKALPVAWCIWMVSTQSTSYFSYRFLVLCLQQEELMRFFGKDGAQSELLGKSENFVTVFSDIRWHQLGLVWRVFDLVLADPLMSRRSQRSCLGNSADGNSSFWRAQYNPFLCPRNRCQPSWRPCCPMYSARWQKRTPLASKVYANSANCKWSTVTKPELTS